ncbi:bile acid:sodium symporter family protein [Nocardia uniformis]|uniref:Bile acid:sodium symporter family protein n=1 Tax=Nocardia uniformis TaxID=53432 RepID=A0A849BPD1_9NOCA|nr:bile acid:sodium symporter family protein [Nocardia uniformis]NNH68433.1 bile acid:sodium symporter family protein [Nocardia uniformis]
MNSAVVSVTLPLALAVIMFGLGLSLTVDDFARVARNPKVVAIALACQIVVLPLVAFGLVLLFELPPILAVGMMLLAASPGGATANLFSHLFRGDVALNVSLTAVNSMLSVVTLPLMVNFALGYFEPVDDTGAVGLQFGKVLQVFLLVLVPVIVGMVLRRIATSFAERMDRPVRIASAAILVFVVVVGVAAERSNVSDYVIDVGAITALFCLVSLTAGYWIPRRLGIAPRQAIACSMEVGIHNSAIAITIAISVLGSTEMAVPAAVYAVTMSPMAALVGWLISRRSIPADSAPDLAPVES